MICSFLVFGAPCMHFLLFYTYVADILERRAQFRGPHLKHAWAAKERGELVLAGALADPVDGGVLWFSTADKSVVERFASDDPNVKSGLVTQWFVREWTTVVGDAAIKPIRPET
jgi:uncharacterized protein YciI